MKRYLKGLTAILPPLAAFAVQLLAVMIQTMVYSVIAGTRAGLEQATGVADAADISAGIQEALTGEVAYLFSAIAILSSGIVFLFWYRRRIYGEPGGRLKDVVNVKNMGKLICLALGFQLFVSGVLGLLSGHFPKTFDEYANTIGNILSGNGVVVAIMTVVIAPITEELIFRGVTLHVANRHVPFLAANILQAILFGIYHGNLVQGIYAAGFGFILGLLYQKYRTVYAPILLHMLVNASAFLIMLLPGSNISKLLMLAVGFVLGFIAMIMIKPLKPLPVSGEVKE
ncbi:MAG TPA: CPBP family intramembrane metalloprotease [Clostridiales bacterium]|nr:CPBP family intramembrane metalloprotease [Clostridiales bacterium]